MNTYIYILKPLSKYATPTICRIKAETETEARRSLSELDKARIIEAYQD